MRNFNNIDKKRFIDINLRMNNGEFINYDEIVNGKFSEIINTDFSFIGNHLEEFEFAATSINKEFVFKNGSYAYYQNIITDKDSSKSSRTRVKIEFFATVFILAKYASSKSKTVDFVDPKKRKGLNKIHFLEEVKNDYEIKNIYNNMKTDMNIEKCLDRMIKQGFILEFNGQLILSNIGAELYKENEENFFNRKVSLLNNNEK